MILMFKCQMTYQVTSSKVTLKKAKKISKIIVKRNTYAYAHTLLSVSTSVCVFYLHLTERFICVFRFHFRVQKLDPYNAIFPLGGRRVKNRLFTPGS